MWWVLQKVSARFSFIAPNFTVQFVLSTQNRLCEPTMNTGNKFGNKYIFKDTYSICYFFSVYCPLLFVVESAHCLNQRYVSRHNPRNHRTVFAAWTFDTLCNKHSNYSLQEYFIYRIAFNIFWSVLSLMTSVTPQTLLKPSGPGERENRCALLPFSCGVKHVGGKQINR